MGYRANRTTNKLFCTTSLTEGEFCARKTRLSPQYFINDRSNAVVLLWFTVACVGVRVAVNFTLRVIILHVFKFGFGC